MGLTVCIALCYLTAMSLVATLCHDVQSTQICASTGPRTSFVHATSQYFHGILYQYSLWYLVRVLHYASVHVHFVFVTFEHK